MIYDQEDFEVKYWGGDYVAFNEDFQSKRAPKRSIGKKLAISLSFVFALAVFPLLIFGVYNFTSQQTATAELASINASGLEKKTVNQITKPEIKPSINPVQTITVINNDSYWKISKRACGTGKFYLSIQNQNNSKALHIGDSVIAKCTL